jgi:hypothetical protein
MKHIQTFESFLNESMTPRNLKVGSIYHYEDVNSSGENISADYEYIGPVGNYDFKFRIVKSYMDEKTKNHYKKLGLEQWYKIGYEFTHTVQALQHYINTGKWTEK